jgi:hypothetical protein
MFLLRQNVSEQLLALLGKNRSLATLEADPKVARPSTSAINDQNS